MPYVPQIDTLGDITRHYGRERPDTVALIFGDRRTTFGELDQITNRIANALQAVKSGGRIAYLGQNSDIYFALVLGTAKAGLVMAPLNWRLASPEIAAIVRDLQPSVIVVEHGFTDRFDRVRAELGDEVIGIVIGGERQGWMSYEMWINAWPDSDPMTEVSPFQTVVQTYTSGTTGKPKGVELSHRAFYALDHYTGHHPEEYDPDMLLSDFAPGDVNIVAMPVFHATGTGWGLFGLCGGITNIVLPQFNIDVIVDIFRDYPISHVVLVPTAIQQLLRHERSRELDFATMKYVVYGASPIPEALLVEAIGRFKCKFLQTYGMTESTGAVTCLTPKDHLDVKSPRLRSAGRAMPGVRITIRDMNGRILPAGEIGEVCIESPTLMNGYWQQPEETAQAITSEGYLRSGDAGRLDVDGYLFIEDRVKDMIITGGENVYPAEVENALFDHPAVEEVSVIGVPDEKWGEAVKAIIVPKAGTTCDPADIVSYARTRMAGYKIPKSVEFVSALPKSETGKVLKRELRRQYWEGLSRNVN